MSSRLTTGATASAIVLATLVELGVPKLWNTRNPFDWMELISMQGKTNFFEKRVGEYQKANVMSNIARADSQTFSLTEDF